MLGKFAAVAALAATGLLAGIAPTQARTVSTSAPVGWYDTNANAAQSRANPAETTLSPTQISKVEYLRTIASGPGSPNAPCGPQPVVAPLPYDNSLYAVANNEVSKYDPATGALAWQQPVASQFYATSLAISANILVVGSSGCESASEPGGTVQAFNATSGAKLWSTRVYGGGPLDDIVKSGSYVIVAGEDAAGYQVTVLNVDNGKLAWFGTGCTEFATAPALVVGGLVMTYGCTSNGGTTLEARNLTTGAPAWSLPGGWTLERGDLPSATGAHLFVTNQAGTVEDLDPATGQVQYSLAGATAALAVDASRVYASCGSGGVNVCAYDLATGSRLWDKVTANDRQIKLAAEADGVLYLDAGAALNASTGQTITTIWPSEYGTQPATALAVGDGRIVVSTDPRTLDLYGLPGS